jgi:diacylglycerol kinase family enzyme
VAERHDVETRVLTEGENAADLARAAGQDGAPALGMAGGDGSLAAVAAVAVDLDTPFVCVPFGTRNHFGRDLGLDRKDPVSALDAFGGQERRVDVGAVGGRLFLNNVSLGLYASFVHEARRSARGRLVALLQMAPAALGRSRRPLDLSFVLDGRRERQSALVVLVANNGYTFTSLADLGERTRLDEGLLHSYVIRAATRLSVPGLLARAVVGRLDRAGGWIEWPAERFSVEGPQPRIHAAVDGEPVVLHSPLEFEIRPRALRVLVPRRL